MTKPPRRPATLLKPASMYPPNFKPYTYRGDQPYEGPRKRNDKEGA